VLKQDYPHEVIVLDNCSTDGTAQFVKEKYPNVKLIKNTRNTGYGAGNNLGVKYAKGKYIVILNPDTIAEDNWLRELIKPLQNEKKIITTPKILSYDGSSIGTCGNINHFTGLTFTRGLNTKPEEYNQEEFVSGISGCNFAIRKEYYESLEGFDENFFVYNEDSDLSWRAHLNDFRILHVPKSVLRHDYDLEVSPQKLYHLEKNRYVILRKYLSKRDAFLLLPSLILADILTYGYAFKQGKDGIILKSKAIKDGFKVNLEKVIGDKKNLLRALSATIPVDQLTYNRFDRSIKILSNKIFTLNYKMVLSD
jgi:GT2 family glycosyltransferase